MLFRAGEEQELQQISWENSTIPRLTLNFQFIKHNMITLYHNKNKRIHYNNSSNISMNISTISIQQTNQLNHCLVLLPD